MLDVRKKLPEIMGKIAVVVLKKRTMADLYSITDEEIDFYDQFKNLSAAKKIELIKSKIHNVCQMLAKNEPDSMWIIVWHEHFLDDGPQNRAIGSNAKTLLKETMLKLEDEFSPHLTIISGATQTKKPFTNSNLVKLKEVRQSHANLKYVANIEEERAIKLDDSRQCQMKAELQKIQQIESVLPDIFYVIRNTCYIFHRGEVKRHDKIVPSQETFFNEEANTMFQPANEKNMPSTFELIHPFTKQVVSIGIEICREHAFGILKLQGKHPTLLHFVLSNSIPFKRDNIHGNVAFHVDSIKNTTVISSSEKYEDFEIRGYNYYIFDSQLIPLRQETLENKKTALKS